MTASLVVVVIVVISALAFDFTNGFHDTANAMATSIATRALPPRIAVALSAVLNLVGAFLSLKVATTIVKGIVDSHVITVEAVLAGLAGAIVWNLVTWLLGLPSSSTHALIGGLVGAAIVAGGWQAIEYAGVISMFLLPALISPAVAFVAALCATFLAYRITARGDQATNARIYRAGQIVSASLVSLAHGTNDAQKTMGVITLALITGGVLGQSAGVPVWVILSCGLAIGCGTYFGAWRVIRTLGKGLSDIQSTQGFAAECCSSAVILVSSHFGFPLSTTHVASGSVMGVGAGRKDARVRWSLAGTIVAGWLVTLPAAACVAAAASGISLLIGGFAGAVFIVVMLAVVALGIYLISKRTEVTPDTVNDEVPSGAVLAIRRTTGRVPTKEAA